MNDLITALEKTRHRWIQSDGPGNPTTNIINGMAPAQRQAITEKFIQALHRLEARRRCAPGVFFRIL